MKQSIIDNDTQKTWNYLHVTTFFAFKVIINTIPVPQPTKKLNKDTLFLEHVQKFI